MQKNGFDILKKEHPEQLDPLFNPIVGGGGWSDGQGQKMKKVVEDKGYTFYFLALSQSLKKIILEGGLIYPLKGGVIYPIPGGCRVNQLSIR